MRAKRVHQKELDEPHSTIHGLTRRYALDGEDYRRPLRIDKKAGQVRRPSRWCDRSLPPRIQDTRGCLRLQVREVFENLLFAYANRKHLQHVLAPDTHPCGCTAPATLLGIEGDASKVFHRLTMEALFRSLKPPCRPKRQNR